LKNRLEAAPEAAPEAGQAGRRFMHAGQRTASAHVRQAKAAIQGLHAALQLFEIRNRAIRHGVFALEDPGP
jgi:hypothetical protein